MPEVPQWARLKTGVSYPLRRGAWYQVVQLTHGVALLDVNHRSMTVPLDLLQVVPTRPQVWSVVPRPRDTVDMPLSWATSTRSVPIAARAHRSVAVFPAC